MTGTRSETRQEGTALVETGTVVHEGREYAATGSVVDHTRGVVVGYPAGRELQAWDGRVIGTLFRVSTCRNRLTRSTLVAYRATVDGRRYWGRGSGDGMVLRLRAAK